MESMLKSMMEQQEKLMAKVEGIQEKQDRMEQQQSQQMIKFDAMASYIASLKGHVDVVRMLVEHGADINKAKNTGATPLFMASSKGHVDVVRVLVEQGADIAKTWDNKTPLQQARQNNHPEIIHLLELAAQA